MSPGRGSVASGGGVLAGNGGIGGGFLTVPEKIGGEGARPVSRSGHERMKRGVADWMG